MIKKSKGEKIFNVINIILLILVSIVCLYPMIYVLCASFSEPMKLLSHTGLLFKPEGWSLAAYAKVFTRKAIFVSYGNTFFYVIVGTIISLVLTSSFAFVLSRKGLFWNKFLSIFALFTMYFVGGIVPSYIVVRNLGMLDTRWAILLPTALSTYNMIIMRSGFASVPVALEEAAEIDGASPLRTFLSIVFPLALPTVAVIALYYCVGQWNSWFNASIYLRTADLFPLQLYLRDILITNNQTEMTASGGVSDANALALGETIKYATIIVSVIPILCVYPFIQKYFTKGVMIGAVKE